MSNNNSILLYSNCCHVISDDAKDGIEFTIKPKTFYDCKRRKFRNNFIYYNEFKYATNNRKISNNSLEFTCIAQAIHEVTTTLNNNLITDISMFFDLILSTSNKSIILKGSQKHYQGHNIISFGLIPLSIINNNMDSNNNYNATPQQQERIEPIKNRYGSILIKINLFQFLIDYNNDNANNNNIYKFYDCGTRVFLQECSHVICLSKKPIYINSNQMEESKTISYNASNCSLKWNAILHRLEDYPNHFDHPEIAFVEDYLEIPLKYITIDFIDHNTYCFHQQTKRVKCCQKFSREMAAIRFFKELAKRINNRVTLVPRELGNCFNKREVKYWLRDDLEVYNEIALYFNWEREEVISFAL
ncbi:hypothetical protein ABK040_004973 [Willaertia magna]